MAVSRFQKGNAFSAGGTYECRACGRRTRETGQGESDFELCAFDLLAGELENVYLDGECTYEEYLKGHEDLCRQYKRDDKPAER